jgi:hypothetical protein
MASGSLKEYLSITYREKINSTATPADDIEGILYKFIPSGICRVKLSAIYVADRTLFPFRTDYTKSAKTFADTVQKDAETFVPPGEKIAAYSPVEQAGNEKLEYGIYKVCLCRKETARHSSHALVLLFARSSVKGILQDSETSTGVHSCSYCCISRQEATFGCVWIQRVNCGKNCADTRSRPVFRRMKTNGSSCSRKTLIATRRFRGTYRFLR